MTLAVIVPDGVSVLLRDTVCERVIEVLGLSVWLGLRDGEGVPVPLRVPEPDGVTACERVGDPVGLCVGVRELLEVTDPDGVAA